MNNEIKEILDYISDRVIEKGKWNKVKDYITNLQQENERIQENNKAMQTEMTITWKKVDDLQKRIEKAVEYIKNDDNFWVALSEDCGKPNNDLDKLLNILNGRSDK